jgi:hypothetical protein
MSRFAAGSRANKCFLCESVVQTQRQRHDVGHEGVITGRDVFSLRSSIADPQGVTQPPLQSTYLHSICFNKCHPQLLVMSLNIQAFYSRSYFNYPVPIIRKEKSNYLNFVIAPISCNCLIQFSIITLYHCIYF